MIHVKIKNSLILFFTLTFGTCFSALPDVKYNYKINNNNVELLVSDDGEFIVLNKTKGKILLKKENILSDGIYSFLNISKEKNFFVMRLVFNGAGGQEQNYYYHIDEDSVSLFKESVRYLEMENNILKDKSCDYFYSNKNNECFYLLSKKSYLYDFKRKKTSMYLVKGDRVKIIKDELDNEGIKWYLINYKGKKDINMWIKADSVDLN
ncbi:hypothetical protein [Rodentibacter pneumotropicus]|uniref:hypothetical protein n=1 Tax=Rodentibacter pneumotropicus TaxID=758 RepID=UPI001EE2EC18|nr:hypothetical protein [Rodentibacter pneumotropicus]